MWEGNVAGRLSKVAVAAFAAACRAGRDYRRGRVEGGENRLLTLDERDEREAYQSAGELRAGLSVGLPISWYTADEVAAYGTAEALAWVLDNTDAAVVRCESLLWENAAEAYSERVEKLEVLLQRFPGEWDAHACARAIENGHMDALVWLHEHGCPWHEETCCHAARLGWLEELRYAVSHGCEYDRAKCLQAARGYEYEDVVAYLEQLP